MSGRKRLRPPLTALLLAAFVGIPRPTAATADKEWLNDALVIISPGRDALGGRVPGLWSGRGGSRIEVTRQVAFSGNSSLKVQVSGSAAGGCSRLVALPPGKAGIVFSCRVFVPPGQPFNEMPSVCVWRADGIAAQAEPVARTGEWVESLLSIDERAGKLFYFGVSASGIDDGSPLFYVDDFVLRERNSELNLLKTRNGDFEEDAGDKRARLIADFQPDLVNVWHASYLNKDGLFHRHGVRIASWGRMEYDACHDWDKRLEEFKKSSAKRDIDGTIVSLPGHPPFTFRMCHHSPIWHAYQKSHLLRIISANDAVGQDCLFATSFRSGDNNCFCEHCQRDFRTHLREVFPEQELARLLPEPLGQFSIARHIKRIRPKLPGFGLLDDAIAREYIRSQYIHAKGFVADIAESVREEAATQGRVVPFFGNQSSSWGGRMAPYSVMLCHIMDAQLLECGPKHPYRGRHRDAWGPLQCKLMRAATRNRKPVWPLLGTKWFQEYPTAARLFVAETLSNGAVPLLIWSASTFPEKSVYAEHARQAQFMNANRAVFLRRRPLARVALVYSVPTSFWRFFGTYWDWRTGSRHGQWIGVVACVLQHAHIPYEPVVFGHPDLMQDGEQLAALKDYDVLVLVDVDCVSERQAAAVREFAARGGRVVVIGEYGTRTEQYQPREKALAEQLRTELGDRAWGGVLPASHVLDFMDPKGDPAVGRAAFAALADAIRPDHPLLSTDAPTTLWTTLWQDASGHRIGLHATNYDVDLERHEFVPSPEANVTILLPRSFEFNRIRFLAPNRAATDVAFQRDATAVSFRLPVVDCYGIALLTSDDELDAANLIETARRNLDRARVAARGESVPDTKAVAFLAAAERAHRERRFAEARREAGAALREVRASYNPSAAE